MSHKLLPFLLVAALCAALHCTPDTKNPSGSDLAGQVDTTQHNPQVDTTQQNPPEPSHDWDWVDGYPVGVSVKAFTDNFTDGNVCKGFIATLDFAANPNLQFNCRKSSKKKGPSAFFAQTEEADGVPCLATNGGYFAGATSVSLVAHNGEFTVSAYRAFNWPNDENAQLTMYPVRSALGQMKDGSFEIQWTYCTSPGAKTHTVFPSWLDNNEKTQTFMPEPPGADYCEGTRTWEPWEAIGGGPRLVKDGVDISTDAYWGECLDSGGTAAFGRHPRTGAGITEDGKLILIVCDGRGMDGSKGYTLAEFAAKFISLGCTDAMNFDGGGSSCIVGAGGAILNHPSDGNERIVSSAIVISELPHK
ncbi:MAG: phosphodiester glycosidase family protein [Bacteroidales bacterium]|nr:phosphodiester glycosidase family protein [Bacteroidales bacterium]